MTMTLTMTHLATIPANDFVFDFMQRDFTAASAGLLAAVACGVIGSFLVLRRMSLMGDAISHAVLPGIVAAFLLTDTMEAMPMFIGAAVVGILTALLSETIHRVGRVESTASMGVVFTVLFAIGVIWLERVGGRSIHLDTDCVLYGNMQNVIWPGAPTSWESMWRLETLRSMPHQVQTLGIVLVVDVLFVVAFFKELRITSFDPAVAASQGIRPYVMHYSLMTMMAITTVAAFEAVGSILVVAMLIVPGVTARLLSDRFGMVILLSAVVATAAATGGYASAAALSLDSTGSVGVMLGVLLVLVGLFSPRYGWIIRAVRRMRMSVTIIAEDILGSLYRVTEARGDAAGLPRHDLLAIGGGRALARMALIGLSRKGAIVKHGETMALTDAGRTRARRVVRSHRLWERYLVDRLGLRADHVHGTATRLEHVTDASMQSHLAQRTEHAHTDPHGKSIPEDNDDLPDDNPSAHTPS